MKEKEIWKDIEGFEGMYQVSNFGRVKSLARIIYSSDGKIRKWKERIRIPVFDGNYYGLVLSNCELKIGRRIHVLVARAFIPNPENKPQVNHKDFNKTNNYHKNLEWCTISYNMKHAWSNGRMKNIRKGEDVHAAKLNEFQVKVIRKTEGFGSRELANIFNVSTSTIWNVKNNNNYWKSVK